jgi:uncharacterized membrane protein YcjF (UPF0283 family)
MKSELAHWWKVLRKVTVTVGLLLSFLFLVEVLRVFLVLRDLYSPLGYIFVACIIAAIFYTSILILLRIKKRPKIIVPPNVGNLQNPSADECYAYCRYLVKYIERLTENSNLNEADVEIARQGIAAIENSLRTCKTASALSQRLSKIEEDSIKPLLSILDKKAQQEVRKSVRDVMIGVTLSPFRAADLLIVVYRNIGMVLRVMRIYNTQPLLAEQISILLDVFRVVATVNYLNFSQKLTEKIFSSVPAAGKFVDDIAQGIDAGLLTSLAGYGAIYRCRAYKKLDRDEVDLKIANQIKRFVLIVNSIFKTDVLPKMRIRIISIIPNGKIRDVGAFWQKISDSISNAIDSTGSTFESFIKKPVVATGRKALGAGVVSISKHRENRTKAADMIPTRTKSIGEGMG